MTRRGSQPRYVVTGRIIKPHGILGWTKVEALTTNPRRFAVGKTFLVEGRVTGERLCIQAVRRSGDVLLVKFRGVEDRNEAEKLKGKRLLVTAEELGEPPEGAFWEHQLLELEVITAGGRTLGRVVEVLETGANDVLVVEGDREHLVPMTAEVVKEVDLENGTIVIEPLPGLLEEEE